MSRTKSVSAASERKAEKQKKKPKKKLLIESQISQLMTIYICVLCRTALLAWYYWINGFGVKYVYSFYCFIAQ